MVWQSSFPLLKKSLAYVPAPTFLGLKCAKLTWLSKLNGLEKFLLLFQKFLMAFPGVVFAFKMPKRICHIFLQSF